MSRGHETLHGDRLVLIKPLQLPSVAAGRFADIFELKVNEKLSPSYEY